ncbi:hypothetical protein ACFX1S_022434 [Malus domestica]
MSASIKICTRRSFRNRRGVAFSKAGLLRDHEGRSQKSKRRLLSQKLGCSKTTKADLRNRRGLLSQKLGCSETTRADLKNRRGLLSQKLDCSETTRADLRNRRGLLSQKLGCSETTRVDLRNRRGTYFSSLVSTCHTHSALRKLWAFCR